jgi:hypothetical protein
MFAVVGRGGLGRAELRPGRARRKRAVPWLAGGLSLLLLVAAPAPVLAEEVEPGDDDVPGQECPLDPNQSRDTLAEADSETSAVLLATLCDVPVEDVSARDYSRRSVAQPSGHVKTDMYAVPQWAKDEAGQWTNVDTRLAAGPDDTLRAAAVVGEVRLSGGGSGPFATVVSPEGDGLLSLRWPGAALPTPQVEGDTATYSGVLPGVDLAVTADVDGFAYTFVVHTPQAAANPALSRIELEVITHGVEAVQDEHGLVTAVNGAGEPVFASGPALMWDTPPLYEAAMDGTLPESELQGLSADDLSPNRISQMELEFDGTHLAVVPDAQMLADAAADRDVVFPLYIDPDFHSVGQRNWATVHKEQPNRGWTNDSEWPRSGGIRMGFCGFSNCYDAYGVWRGVMRFDTKPLRNRHIVSAAVKMTQTHTGGCDSYYVQLWHIYAFTNGASWNDITWRNVTSDGYLQRRSVASSNSTGCGTSYPNRDITFNNSNVRARVQLHADAPYDTISFGVRSNNESTWTQWRRVSRNSLRLEVEHTSYPQTPTGLSTDGTGCATSAPGPWLTTGRPSLAGTPRNADGTGRYRQQLREVGSSSDLYTFLSGVVTVNIERSRRIPSAEALADGEYRWRMRTESHVSGVPASSYASWCYFRVDTTPPPQPAAVLLTENPEPGGTVQFQLVGSTDTDRFRYSLSGGSTTTVSAAGGNRTITVDLTDSTIDHHLQVWAMDEAGNLSARHDLFLTAAKESRAPVAGAWRFDGDLLDDSGQGHHLTPDTEVLLTNDRRDRTESAVRSPVTGGCLQSDGPVLDTTDSFTVAAWARVLSEEGSSMPAVVTQSGFNRAAFYLEYRHTVQRWNFKMPSADVSDPSWRHARANELTPLGQWQHVAGVYDAPAQQLRLYVDGVLNSVVDAHATTWQAESPFTIGCNNRLDGGSYSSGDIEADDVVAYQGVLSGGQIWQLREHGLPAGELSWWPMRGNGADAGPGGNDLAAVAGAVSFVPDSHGRLGSAMGFDGGSCVATDAPVLADGHSFTVAAWVRLDDKESGADTTFLSQRGQTRPSFGFGHHAAEDRWQFSIASGEITGGELATVTSTSVPQVGVWTHLMAVVDTDARRMKLYVDGVLEQDMSLPWDPWHTSGPLHVGCAVSDEVGTFGRFVGAVHDVRVWRGAATPGEVNAVVLEQVSSWALDEFTGGTDAWGDNHLIFHGSHDWVEDRFGQCFAAYGLKLDGGGYAHTDGTVIVTDESFTVSAWAKLDDKAAHRTVVAQAAPDRASFGLNYNPSHDRWTFTMRSENIPSGYQWHSVRSNDAPEIGVWYHLAAVFDLGAGTVNLFVDGELQDTAPGPQRPWHADGEFLIGTAGDAAGGRYYPMVGAIDQVRVFAGVLDGFRIADQGIRPLVPVPPGDCDFF